MYVTDFHAAEPTRPRELLGLKDDDRLVHFVDAVAGTPEEAGAAVDRKSVV